MTKELRPCTFCGRTEYVRVEVVDELVETGTEEDPEPSKVPIFAVYCGYCGASGPQELDSDDAAHAWNRRAGRTCRPEVCDDGAGAWGVYCSECGYRFAGPHGKREVPEHMATRRDIMPRYCPSCGSRVEVSE